MPGCVGAYRKISVERRLYEVAGVVNESRYVFLDAVKRISNLLEFVGCLELGAFGEVSMRDFIQYMNGLLDPSRNKQALHNTASKRDYKSDDGHDQYNDSSDLRRCKSLLWQLNPIVLLIEFKKIFEG